MSKAKARRARYLRAERARKARQFSPESFDARWQSSVDAARNEHGVAIEDMLLAQMYFQKLRNPDVEEPVLSVVHEGITWCTCARCGLPFSVNGQVVWMKASPASTSDTVYIGPCPRCEGPGTPITVFEAVNAASRHRLAGTHPDAVARALAEVVGRLAAGAEAEAVLRPLVEQEGLVGIVARKLLPLAKRLGRDVLISLITAVITSTLTGGDLKAEDVERIIDERVTEVPSEPQRDPEVPADPDDEVEPDEAGEQDRDGTGVPPHNKADQDRDRQQARGDKHQGDDQQQRREP